MTAAGVVLGRWALVAAWGLLLLTLSSDAFGGDETGRWLRTVLVRIWPEVTPATIRLLHASVRKLAHLGEYSIFAVLLARALVAGGRARGRAALLAVALAAAFALADEARQGLTRSRVPSLRDVALDACGAATGALLWRRRRAAQ